MLDTVVAPPLLREWAAPTSPRLPAPLVLPRNSVRCGRLHARLRGGADVPLLWQPLSCTTSSNLRYNSFSIVADRGGSDPHFRVPEDSSPLCFPSRFRIPPFCLRWALPLRSRLAIGQKAREGAHTAGFGAERGRVSGAVQVGGGSGRGSRLPRGGKGQKPAGQGSAAGGAPAVLILLTDPLPPGRTAAGAAAAPCRRQPPLPAADGASAAGAATPRLVSPAAGRGGPPAPGVFSQPLPRSARCGGLAIVTTAPGPLVSCSARCSLSSFPEASDRRLHLHRGPAAHAHVPARRRAEPRRRRCAVLQPAAVPPLRYAGAGAAPWLCGPCGCSPGAACTAMGRASVGPDPAEKAREKMSIVSCFSFEFNIVNSTRVQSVSGVQISIVASS